MPEYNKDIPSSVKAWERASYYFANNSSGTVHAVLGENIRPDSVWNSIEYNTLIQNSNVTKIIKIDPKTLAEQVIFRR